MRRIETVIPDVFLIEPKMFEDARGFFLERYRRDRFEEIGITDDFVQDNHARSTFGIIRGLHYQLKRPQAKLCWVVHGEVLDVVVDLRVGSPYFGKTVSATLSAENRRQIYVPEGFAHGYSVLSGTADFLYKCSDFYDPTDERGIAWDDAELAIDWMVDQPLLSEKDRNHRRLSEVPKTDLPTYKG